MNIRTQIFLTCFLLLTWQGLVITRTLQTRLEERTNQVQTLINRI